MSPTIAVNRNMSELPEVLEDIRMLSSVHGLNSYFMFDKFDTGVTLTAMSKDQVTVRISVSTVIPMLSDASSRSRHNRYFDRSNSKSYGSKRDLVADLRALSAPEEVLEGLKRAKVSTVETFLDTSDDKVFRVTHEKSREASAEASWSAEWNDLPVELRLKVAGYTGSRPSYTLEYDIDNSSLIEQILSFFRENGIRPMPGEIH